MAYKRSALKADAFLKVCPLRLVLERIGQKWALMAIVALASGPLRFGGLMNKLEGISQKMLSQTLRGLERDGLLNRKSFEVVPLRVEYSLTERGKTLLPLAMGLKSWAEGFLHEVANSNSRYDARARQRLSRYLEK